VQMKGDNTATRFNRLWGTIENLTCRDLCAGMDQAKVGGWSSDESLVYRIHGF